jgi:hypothetical protein
MRYQKPTVVNLGASSRSTGQGPLGCFSGTTPGAPSFWCQNGTTVSSPTFYNCNTGPQPAGDTTDICVSGLSPSSSFCMLGEGGGNLGDTCTVGPSAVP